jgi:hypothetical protein
MAHKKSIGLKGGPNEYITDISEFVSIEGYKRNSPDVNNPVNIIESSNITMNGVDFPVRGYGNNGKVQDMMPGVEHYDYGNADYVVEVPIAKRGGGLLDKTMKCNSCGWEWKAADGGSDIDTCHKCGGKALAKAQTGTEKNFRDFEGVPLLSSLVAGDIPGDQHHKSRLADLYRYYAGKTLEDDILEVSNTKPTKAKDTDVKYISLNKNQQLVQEVIDNYNRVSTGNFYTNKTRPDLIMSADDNEIQLDANNYKVTGYKEVDDIDDHQLNAIGNYFTGLGEDDNGTYISYYDKFDQAGGLGGSINFGEVLGLTKPFEIYDRIYVEKDSETGKYIQKKQDGGSKLLSYQSRGETGNAVVFVESPWRDKYTYDLYDTSNKNLPAELLQFRKDFNFGENKLQGLYGDMSKEKLDNKYLKFLNGLYKDLYNQERQLDIDGKPSDKIHAQRMQTYKVIQGEEKKIDQKYQEQIDLYSNMVDDGQESFNNNELNPRTTSMDSTFYKEAENLKKVYARLHPNSNVDIVPIYDNPDLVRDKVAELNPNDSMYFFGHSGDRLGGIPNEEIATILGGSKAENCYLGTCALEEQELQPFQEALQGRNLQYRPAGSWWGVNPSGSSIEDAMWSRVTKEGRIGLPGVGNNATVVKPKLGKDYNKEQDGGQPTQPKTWQDTINYIDQEKLKRAIAQVESLNGKLMKNPDSTASGLYGQRFSELQEGKLYDGTRDEFIADLEAQNRMFDIRLNEGFKSNKTTPLLKDAYDLMNEYKPQIENFDFSYEDIISLSNFLGRQGTREYLGNVIRDGKTLQEVYPKLYGESVKQSNKTPEEYLNITRGYYKQYAGEMEMREVVQDNTRVASPIFRDLPNLAFQPQSPLQQFLIDAESELDLLNINNRTVAQDNTAVAGRFVPPINIGDSRAMLDYDQIIGDISQENDLEESSYDSPALIAEFIRKSNEYASGWKDMTDASDAEVKDLQNVLLGKGYNIGPTGVDGDYGTKTLAAHRAMVDDTNLNPSSISRYYNKFNLDNKQEVMGIQKILVDKGFLAPTLIGRQSTSIDGKFGNQTKDALDAFNTENAKDDPQALVFDYIPSTLEEPRCAAGMCQILEGNQVLTDALGVKFKDAWDIFENMTESKNSDSIFNIYDDKAFDNVSSVEDLKRITKEVKRKKQTTEGDYQIGDIVGLYWDGSSHHNETLSSKTHNTHSGFVSDIVDGVPIITHNVNGNVRQQPYNELVTAWIRRPNENLDIKSQYNVDGIEEMQFDSSGIQNLAFRYSGTDVDDKVVYEGERLEQLENIFKRVQFNANKIPKILNSSVDSKWLESTVIGITGVETGVGKSVPRTVEDYGKFRNLVYDAKGKKDEDVSLGIGKTKFNSLDSFAKEYFDIKSVDDLAEDSKGIDAVTYMITKNYELFKDYAKTYPQLGLTETDIRNMTILSYNQGASRLLKTGRVDDDRSAQEEVQALRELYDATLLDITSTNYKHVPLVADAAFKVGQMIPEFLPGSVRPSDSYIKKVNQYRADVFPETFASVEAAGNEFQPSTMAQGGEYGVYNNYMSGKYDGTSREKGAMELYDKLNRKHYQEAKQTGMSVPNYIMSQLIKDS